MVLVSWLEESVEGLQRRVIGIVLVHLIEARIILLCCVLIYSSIIICFLYSSLHQEFRIVFFYEEKIEGYFLFAG